MIIEVYYKKGDKGVCVFLNYNKKRHRLDGPAKIWWDGECYWYVNNQYQEGKSIYP